MSTAPSTRQIQEAVGAALEAPFTVADLLKKLGGIPAARVRMLPIPGTATEDDLLRNNESMFRTALCELVEGTLVEKPVGYEESEIAFLIGTYINLFVLPRKVGIVLGEAGTLRLCPGLVRAPDVSFIARTSFPDGKRPKEPIPNLVPDLAVEVLSKSNTKKEMEGKLREYFGAGTRLVWLVDPKKRTVRVFVSPTSFTTLAVGDTLAGGVVLPGFQLAVRELFERD
jgi:Uma2 family endonuclease